VLRDYSSGKAEITRELSLSEAESLTTGIGEEHIAEMPAFNKTRVDADKFWCDFIHSWNVSSGIIEDPEKNKLQSLFKERCLPFLTEERAGELEAQVKLWIDTCKCVKEKKVLSPYDKTNPTFVNNHGSEWQEAMLRNSREGGTAHFISTGSSITDFSFAITELNLTISSKNNRFSTGSRNSINPDGLGVRKNGFLTILEIKGPSDDCDLVGPMLQAACAATAVVANSEFICKELKIGAELRPAYKKAKVPKRDSIGLHVLTSKKKSRNRKLEQWSPKIESQCQTLLKAFKQLQYIAFSFVEPENTNGFSVIKIDRLIEK